MGALAPGTRAETDTNAIVAVFGKSVPIAVLVPRGDPAREEAVTDELEALDAGTVVSYANTVGTQIPAEFLGEDVEKQFYSEHFSRIVLYSEKPEEGTETFAFVEKLRGILEKYYPGGWFAAGESVNLTDMKDVVGHDNRVVTALSMIAIGIVLLITFRSISIPLLLLFAIESAIWINMSVSYFTGTPLSYIGYLIVSTVQLGATVDYAILTTDHYLACRVHQPPREAALTALGRSFRSVLISAGILALAGFTLNYTSTNSIVQALGFLLGRGALLSFFLVNCFLPTALIALDPFVRKTTIGREFHMQKELVS